MDRVGLLLFLAVCGASGFSCLGQKLSCAPFLPDMTRMCQTPVETLRLGGLKITCGDVVQGTDINAVTSPPTTVGLLAAKQNVQYTLLMLDPDAPSSDPSRGLYWLHWIVTDIDGNSLLNNWQVRGNVKIGYHPPTPPSGTHRYLFLAYEQHTSPQIDSHTERSKFNLVSFLENNGYPCSGPVGHFMYQFSKQ